VVVLAPWVKSVAGEHGPIQGRGEPQIQADLNADHAEQLARSLPSPPLPSRQSILGVATVRAEAFTSLQAPWAAPWRPASCSRST